MSSELSVKVKEIMEREMRSLGLSILDKQCQHLNIVEEYIRPEDLPALAGRLSEVMRTCGGYDKAKRVYSDIRALRDLDELAEMEDDVHKIEVLENLAKASLYAGEFEKASNYYDKLLSGANAQDDQVAKAKYLLLTGMLHKEKAEFDLALALFEKALMEAEEAKDPRHVSKSYCRIGDIYWYKGEFRKALEAYDQAVKNGEDDSDLGAAHVGLGNVYQGRLEMAKAITHYIEALSKLKKTDNYQDLARAYNNLGDTYLQMEDWESAIENFRRGEEYGEKGGWVYVQAFTQFNTAEALVRWGKLEEGKETVDKSMEILTQIGNKPGLAGAYHVYGMYYLRKKDKDKMVEYYTKSVELYDEVNMPHYVARFSHELGLGYKEWGDSENALRQFKKALEVYEEIQLDNMVKKVKRDIANLRS